MKTPEDPQEILESILITTPFSKSDIHKKLLTYLVTCYQKNIIPTEHDIATHVFERGDDFNSADDTIVRVNVYKLRKKLESYYKNEGNRSHQLLTIPKGHYYIEFRKRSHTAFVSYKQNRFILLAGIILFSLLLAMVLRQRNQLSQQRHYLQNFQFIDSDSRIWGNFFDNDLPTSIVIGDFYIYEEFFPGLGRNRRIMDYEIDQEEELDTFISAHPGPHRKKLPIGELPHHSIFTIQDISHVFYSFQRDFSLKMSSTFDLNDTRQNNIIYIGAFKSLRLLEGFLSNQNVAYQSASGFSGMLHVLNVQKDTIKTFDCSGIDLEKESKNIDYCLLLKQKGPDGESFIFIVGFGYIGQLETVRMLSQKDLLNDLEADIRKQKGHVPDNFLMVLEISGFYMTPYQSEISYFREIEPKMRIH